MNEQINKNNGTGMTESKKWVLSRKILKKYVMIITQYLRATAVIVSNLKVCYD